MSSTRPKKQTDSGQPLTGCVICITGTNRGIGLEFVRQLAAAGNHVIAGYRTKKTSAALFALARSHDHVECLKMDVLKATDLEAVRHHIRKHHRRLDVLINNAGISIKPEDHLKSIELSDLTDNFNANVGGPFLTARILHPLLKRGNRKLIVNITSKMGSIAWNKGGATPYRLSKAALNMLTSNQAIEYQTDRIAVVCIHPGWVVTDMGGSGANLAPEQSVSDMLKVIAGVGIKDSGSFLSFDGSVIPY